MLLDIPTLRTIMKKVVAALLINSRGMLSGAGSFRDGPAGAVIRRCAAGRCWWLLLLHPHPPQQGAGVELHGLQYIGIGIFPYDMVNAIATAWAGADVEGVGCIKQIVQIAHYFLIGLAGETAWLNADCWSRMRQWGCPLEFCFVFVATSPGCC